MVGNDIVDLNQAQKDSNWTRKGYLEKIFSSAELRRIDSSNSPETVIWRYWTMKESAYKIIVQKEKRRFFNPKVLYCTILNEKKGIVHYHENQIDVFTKTLQSYVYSFCSFQNGTNTINRIFNGQGGSFEVWKLKEIGKFFGLKLDEIKIKKDELGVPKIYFQDRLTPCSISVTHHGQFAAICLTNPDLK